MHDGNNKPGMSYENAIRYAVEHRVGYWAIDKQAKWSWEFASNGWVNHVCTNCGGKINTDVHVSIDLPNCPFCGAHMTNVRHTPYDGFSIRLDLINALERRRKEYLNSSCPQNVDN